jgi:hypothetical protein
MSREALVDHRRGTRKEDTQPNYIGLELRRCRAALVDHRRGTRKEDTQPKTSLRSTWVVKSHFSLHSFTAAAPGTLTTTMSEQPDHAANVIAGTRGANGINYLCVNLLGLHAKSDVASIYFPPQAWLGVYTKLSKKRSLLSSTSSNNPAKQK